MCDVSGVSDGEGLRCVGERCRRLETLYLSYIGLGAHSVPFWNNLRHFTNIRNLRWVIM